ncbi:MAG: RNA polymerase sigma factor [Pelotomaculum sp.]
MNHVGCFPVGTESSDDLSQVYREYYAKIYKYTIYRVGDPYTAEDLVSEVFEKVLLRYHTYNAQKAKFSTWLFAIANNTIINYHNKNNRSAKLPTLEKVEPISHLEDLIIRQEAKEILLKAIMGLEERQKNIIALKFGGNLTNREIAQIMGLKETNVGTILYRSLKRLRDILKEAI